MDNYIERKANGTLLPFDYSDGPPYVHPDSSMQLSLKIRITRKQMETISSGVTSPLSDEDPSEEEDSADETGSSSEGYEEDQNGTRQLYFLPH